MGCDLISHGVKRLEEARWGERGEDTGKGLLSYLQSLYYQTLSDHRARFNEAVPRVFSHPLFTSPRFLRRPSLYLGARPPLLCLSALFISIRRCSLFDGSGLALSSSSHPSVLLSLPQVDYRTEDGTANAGSDYEFAEGTLLFKPGETQKGKKNKK